MIRARTTRSKAMPIPTESRTVQIGGVEYVAEAALNN